MEETVTEGASAALLLCRLLFGAAECEGGMPPAMVPADECAGLTSRYELVIGSDQAVLDESAAVVLEDRLARPGLCGMTTHLNADGALVLEIETPEDPMAFVGPMLRPGTLAFQAVALDYQPGQTLPAGLTTLPGTDGQAYVVEEEPLMYGDALDAVAAEFTSYGQWAINIAFSDKGMERFGQITTELMGQPLAIVLDDRVLSAPMIHEPILGGRAMISGSFTEAEAHEMAAILASGPLPPGLSVLSIEALPLTE